VRDLANRFLTAKLQQVEAGEITRRTWADYKAITDRLVAVLGDRLVDDLAADDFDALRAAISETRGLVSLGNDITRTRVVFNWAYESGLIDKPMRYGPGFKKPKAAALRRQKQQARKRMFAAETVNQMLASADQPLSTMILMGINCALGNSDVAHLRTGHIDLGRGMLDYSRPKTGIERRAALWPKTVAALREWLDRRPQPKSDDDADLVFITAHGNAWDETNTKPLAKAFAKLLKSIDASGGFYDLRRTYRTIADASMDYPAVNLTMGHHDASMGGVYRQHIDDARLRAVAEHVRAWLFAGDDDDDVGRAPQAADPQQAPRDDENNDRPALRVVG